MALTVIAAYDIADDGRRSKVAARLQRWGDRIQYSVFVCTLDDDDLQSLVAQLSDMLDLSTDSLYVARQCVTCWDGLVSVGQASPDDPALCWLAL